MNLKNNLNFSLLIALVFSFLPISNAFGQMGVSPLSGDCQQLNEWMSLLQMDDIELYHPDLVREVYEEQGCQPLWYNPVTTFIFTNELLSVLENPSIQNGYHLDLIEPIYVNTKAQLLPLGLFDFNSLSDLDVLLTDAALHYALNIQNQIGKKASGATALDEETTNLLLIDGLLNALRSESLPDFFDELEEGVQDFEISSFEEKPYTEDELEETIEEELKLEKEETEKMVEEAKEELEETVVVVEQKDTTSNKVASQKPSIQDSSIFAYVQQISQPASKSIFKEALYHPAWIDSFYKSRNYAPAWHNDYTLYGKASEVIEQVENAAKEGLQPKDYHGNTLIRLYNQLNKVYDAKYMEEADFLPQMDILITDAALQYAHHLRHGRLNSDKIDMGWKIEKDAVIDLYPRLQQAVANQDIQGFFEKSRPQHEEYQQLMQSLAYYQALKQEKKGWLTNLKSGKLELGMEDKAVVRLRERLAFEKGLVEKPNTIKTTIVEVLKSEVDSSTLFTQYAKIVELKDSLILTQIDSVFNPAIFDSTVHNALVAFQGQHGIADDGVIGPNTLSVLNVSLDHRIQQILVALEQWRWMPNKYSDFYVLVNIPAFELDVYKKGKIDLNKKVMVGKTIHKTVIFNNHIRYLELNPYWNVPRSIATKEILPKLKRNLSYLNRQNMEILSGGKVINPYNVNWSKLSRRNFPYRIRQEPGKKNALGTVKFMFPNSHSIYLHDTPSKSLFVKTERAYSHGCIRLDNPVQFAEYLLQDNPKWDAKKIQKVLDSKKNTRVNLEKKIPIYIAYFTAWVDENGLTHFQKDVYGKDKEVMKAL